MKEDGRLFGSTSGASGKMCSECNLDIGSCRATGCGYPDSGFMLNTALKLGSTSTKVASELEHFRAQLGSRLSSHGISLPYTGAGVGGKAVADHGLSGGGRGSHRSGSPHHDLNFAKANSVGHVFANGGASKRRAFGAASVPCLVDIGGVDLARAGLMWSPQHLAGVVHGRRSIEQLNIPPTIDFGGLDMATMGVRCGPREPRAIPGLAIKRKSKLQPSKDSASMGRGQVVVTVEDPCVCVESRDFRLLGLCMVVCALSEEFLSYGIVGDSSQNGNATVEWWWLLRCFVTMVMARAGCIC